MANFDSIFTGAQIDAALTKANSATQPGDLGTAALTAATDYATAAQGLLADSAAQPATTLAGYGITDAQPLAAVLSDTTAAFTTGQANAIIANTAKTSNATHTGDVTGATALTIANDAVTNAKAANMATATIKGRTSAGTGDPEDLTPAQARTVMELGTAATTASTAYATAAQGTLAGTATQPADIALMVESDVTGVTGADAVTNIMSLTQAEYDDIVTPNSSTLYAITDA